MQEKTSRLRGWRLIAFIVLIGAGIARLILALLMHNAHKTGDLPTWPVTVGDVFTIRPGDLAIEKWATQPDNDGFIVEQLERDGRLVGPKICALQPDYLADPASLGGTLTVLALQRLNEWRLRWQGGDTLPGENNPDQIALNCGHEAEILMTTPELHSWYRMQHGDPEPHPTMTNNMLFLDLPKDDVQKQR
jgi:hypothetical protein